MRVDHDYGPRVVLLDEVWARTALARMSSPGPADAVFLDLLHRCFQRLAQEAAELLPQADARLATRMTERHPAVQLAARVLTPAPVVIVDLARAGMLPAHVVQRELMMWIDPLQVRVDHVYMQRLAGDDGRVTGVATAGSKIGGSVAGATLILPDPMGATGTSVEAALAMYRAQYGAPARVVLLHLIVTPEYLARVTRVAPDAHIFALRLDRGLSPPDVLAARPGARWSEERGLDATDYIVPGAGGVGELINNCY
jgi:uracil phosphoribosyltransferase